MDATAGHLTSDDGAIASALHADPTQAKRLFASLAAGLEPLVKRHTGGTGAILDARVPSGDRQSRDIDPRMRRATRRLDDEQQRLSRQFAGMEQALGAARTQQAWLAGMVKR